MIEIVITTVIFLTAALGILTAITMFQSPSNESARRLKSSYIARRMIDELRSNVDERLWKNKESGLLPGEIYTRSVGNYIVNWYLLDVPDLSVRQLLMNVYEK